MQQFCIWNVVCTQWLENRNNCTERDYNLFYYHNVSNKYFPIKRYTWYKVKLQKAFKMIENIKWICGYRRRDLNSFFANAVVFIKINIVWKYILRDVDTIKNNDNYRAFRPRFMRKMHRTCTLITLKCLRCTLAVTSTLPLIKRCHWT